MAWSHRPEAPPRPLDDMTLTETVPHPHLGSIHISATVNGDQVWAAWGERVPTVRVREAAAPLRAENDRIPSPIGARGAVVQFNVWEYDIVGSSLVPIPHRRWLAKEARVEGRRYVRRAYGPGSVIEREGHGLVLSAERRMHKQRPWPGKLAPLVDPLDASLALVWDRAVPPSDLTFFV